MIQKKQLEDYFQVTNKDIENIEKIINEDKNKLQVVEDLLQEWIKYEQHLPKNYDRNMARNFIRGSKFNLEITKRKFEGYFLAKFAFPEFYQNRNPHSTSIQQASDSINVVFMPKLTQQGERICIFSLQNPDPGSFHMESCIKLFWMLYDLVLTSSFPVSSEIVIFDANNVPAGILTKILCSAFKNSITIFRDAYAVRISQIHIINCPVMAEKILIAVKPLLHEKARERIMVHRGLGTILEQINPEFLPNDFGGSLLSLRSYMEQWKEILLGCSDWFHEQEYVGIIGKPPKRINKFRNDDGVVGSFRQLNID